MVVIYDIRTRQCTVPNRAEAQRELDAELPFSKTSSNAGFQTEALPTRRKSVMGPDEMPENRQILCSGCLQAFSESLVHVIPYFNSDVNEYVTTYRCEQCWRPALEETRTRLASTQDEAEIASAATFFQRHGVHIHEFMRSDPASVVQKVLLRMIDLMRSEVIRISIGKDHPLDEK
jgi:hypothetical protein